MEAISTHPNHALCFGDEKSMQNKPNDIRNLTIAEQVQRRLDVEGSKRGLRTFCSKAQPVGGYDVVCALQVPELLFQKHPAFEYTWLQERKEASFGHSCIMQILEEGRRGLMQPEPGETLADEGIRSAAEVIKRAATNLMMTPFIEDRFSECDLFDVINAVSQASYEGKSEAGTVVFATANDQDLSFMLKFDRPTTLTQTRWARKLLQMSSSQVSLVADYNNIIGLGEYSDASTRAFAVDFQGHGHWDFRRGKQVLLRCSHGDVRLPQETIGKERFNDNMRRIFETIEDVAIERFRSVLDVLVNLRRGSSLVIASDAVSEAKRLEHQGTVITPTPLNAALIERATLIDGTVLVDQEGICHAIGVILDGPASIECTPSRGSRYNSVVRYVEAASVPRIAFVISEDRTLDIVPLLRPTIERRKIEQAVSDIAVATNSNYYKLRAFLNQNRFYLNKEQCQIVNAALHRMEKASSEQGNLTIITERFEQNPEFNDSYLKD